MRRPSAIATAVLVTAAITAACAAAVPATPNVSTTNAPAGLTRFYSQTLTWKSCGKAIECTSYRVPLDYAKPAGRAITIAVARARATGTSLGPLLINPGGPGASGISYIRDPQYAISATARRNFDLVSWDPRGVGASTALWCLKGAALDRFLDVDATPDTAAEQRAIVTAGKALAVACKAEDAGLMAHVSSAEMARDLDVLRALLGQQRLRYIGKSWGTVLGKTYAALFPTRVGAFVLDGVVDLTVSAEQGSLDQGAAFEATVDRFIRWCIDQGTCPLGPTPPIAKQRLLDFLRGLDRRPMPTDSKARPLTEAQGITAVIGPLYITNGGWDWLLAALTPALDANNGRPLQTIFDWFVERGPKGVYANNANTAIYAVNCLDAGPSGVATGTIADARAKAVAWGKRLPFMGPIMAWGELPCAQWPFKAGTDITKLKLGKVPPMLIVSATHDPATPLKWGAALAREVPNAVHLVREGDGHTSYANDNACIDKAVDAFLLSDDVWEPKLPARGTRCA